MPIDTIILSVGHMGKPPGPNRLDNPFDRGASINGIYESDLALRYAIFIRERFFVRGYKTFLITHGSYYERHLWANRNCPAKSSLYLSCHLNAGEGRYSLTEHYYDASDQTKQIAENIATQFHQVLGTEYPDMSFAPGGVREIPKCWRGSVCLENTAMSALLIEPFFLDNPEHLNKYYKRLSDVAMAVYNGVVEFNQNESC